MNAKLGLILGAAAIALLACVPLVASGYQLALGISLLYFTVLATAWALFSGPTHYISLATVAFFGIGAYTVAVLGEAMPWAAVLVVAGLIGIAVALVVGLSTLRLSGIYFVIFTFGLSELIRQVVSWYEINVHRSVGRYIFLSITQEQIYWQLLALVALVLLTGWLIGRSRLGLALRVIGDDETVARHSGIDTTRAKLTMFAVSALFMTLTGAVMAPRWTYIDPAIAFSPMLSFEVVIMALLGGAGSLFGPLLGAVPLVLLFEVLTANFPNYFSILLGAVFVLIVYALPRGVVGLFNIGPHRSSAPAASAAVAVAAEGAPLAVQGLRKAFGGLVAVDDLSFDVKRGEIVGLIGPNGSGKTTVLNLISGALGADAGAVSFRERDIVGLGAHRIARLGIARTFQLVRVLESMSVIENVMVGFAFGRAPLAGAAAEQAAAGLLVRVGLGGKADLPATQLTYIDQKRLELGRALALSPDLLLLDEWLAGLNPTELAEGITLIRSLRDSGITIILVEHVMDAIRSLCDRCIVMNVGAKIAEGTPAAVLADKEVVRAYWEAPMLEVRGLSAQYGKHRALAGIDLDVAEGEIVVILGANGAGKSTLLKAIAGLVPALPGARVALGGRDLLALPPHEIVEAGVALVPEGRGIFPELTVRENLELGAYARRARSAETQNAERVRQLFPRLAERRAQMVRTMSGGEQQMVAIARALMSAPDLLLLDEPSLGLSPLMCGELFRALASVRETGVSILLVEQNAKQGLNIADRGYLIETGRIVGQGGAAALKDDPAVQRAYLGALAAS